MMKSYLTEVICLAALFNTVVGTTKCFDCAYNDDTVDSPKSSQACKDADEKYITTCDKDKPYCLKIAGRVNDKPAGLRQCAGKKWKDVLNEEDSCIEASNIPKFSLKLDKKSVVLTNGTVCICNSNECNGQDSNMISNKIILVFLTILSSIYSNCN